jgi:hypothetical protein
LRRRSNLSFSEAKTMRAIKDARKFIQENPSHASALLFSRLVLALESDTEFPLGDLYKMGYDHFDLAIEILREWRLDRYYSGKGRLLDLSQQVQQAQQH